MIQQQMLWQTNFASTSFFMAMSVFDRTASPNFRFTIDMVLSMFERRW